MGSCASVLCAACCHTSVEVHNTAGVLLGALRTQRLVVSARDLRTILQRTWAYACLVSRSLTVWKGSVIEALRNFSAGGDSVCIAEKSCW